MSHLPAAGVLPVQVESIKVMLLNERDHILDEPGPGGGAVDQSAVLVSLAVIPASESESDLNTRVYWIINNFHIITQSP